MTRRDVRELDVKIGFMEGIIRRDPRFVEALQILGDHYTQRGKFDHSLKVDKRLSRLEPENPLVFYNLACSYSLNSEFNLAAASLEKRSNSGIAILNGSPKTPTCAGFENTLSTGPSKTKSGR